MDPNLVYFQYTYPSAVSGAPLLNQSSYYFGVPLPFCYAAPAASFRVQPPLPLASPDPAPESESQDQQQPGVLEDAGKRSSKDSKSSKHTRKTWTKQEDAKILKIIEQLNLGSNARIPYRIIAKEFQGRTSKQIRERYLNKLDSKIINTEFTPQDDQTIYSFYLEYGPKWKRLSSIIKGRTPTALKNRFNTKIKPRLPTLQASPPCLSTTTTFLTAPTGSLQSTSTDLNIKEEIVEEVCVQEKLDF